MELHPIDREPYAASVGASRSSHRVRGTPTANAATTHAVAMAAIHAGQTTQAPAIATPCSASSNTTRSGPGVATNVCFLSPGVEKIAGRPTRMTTAGMASQIDQRVTAQGPHIHATISTRNRSPELSGVSKG